MWMLLGFGCALTFAPDTGADTAAADTAAADSADTDCPPGRWRPDLDGDGFGDEAAPEVDGCAATPGMVPTTGDCDDRDPAVSPDAREVCDGVDQDCDGRADEGLTTTAYPDADGDGYGDAGAPVAVCALTDGLVADASDCDDADAAVSPAATEVCANGVDDDCDGARASCGLAGTYALDATEADAYLLGAEDAGVTVRSLARAGDLDGDGRDDVIVGARGASGLGGAWVGSAPSTGTRTLAEAGLVLWGENIEDVAGHAVAGVGDATGDGVPDLLVGAYGAAPAGRLSGAVYLVSGARFGEVALADADAVLLGGAVGDRAGTALAGAGDVDGDGLADLLVGADQQGSFGSGRGEVYLVPGGTTGTVALADAPTVFAGTGGAGSTVSAGDLDGDGVSDMVIGGYAAAYVVRLPVSGRFDLADADAVLDLDWVTSSAVLGDVDGDGLADVGVGNAEGSGAVYVYTGAIAGTLTERDAAARISGGLWDHLGTAVARAGDVDADGFADMLVTASAGGTWDRGAALLVYGPPVGVDATFEAVSDGGGGDVVAGADVDGDGHSDVLVSATAPDLGDVGAVLVFLGATGW